MRIVYARERYSFSTVYVFNKIAKKFEVIVDFAKGALRFREKK